MSDLLRWVVVATWILALISAIWNYYRMKQFHEAIRKALAAGRNMNESLKEVENKLREGGSR